MVQGMKYTEIDVAEIDTYLHSEAWVMQQKFDGTRCLISIDQEAITFQAGTGAPLTHAAARLHFDRLAIELRKVFPRTGETYALLLDAELLIRTGELFVFDLIRADVFGGLADARHAGIEVAADDPQWLRYTELCNLLEGVDGEVAELLPSVEVAEQWVLAEDKVQMWDALRKANVEGAVFKHHLAPYDLTGKRVKTVVKAKLVKTADVVVTEVNRPDAKHGSFTFGVHSNEDGVFRVLGKCSAIGKPNAQVGDVIEVAYLYRDDSGGLVQPRMMSIREDKVPDDCTLDQFPAYSRKVVTSEALSFNAP